MCLVGDGGWGYKGISVYLWIKYQLAWFLAYPIFVCGDIFLHVLVKLQRILQSRKFVLVQQILSFFMLYLPFLSFALLQNLNVAIAMPSVFRLADEEKFCV